jgi:hypothetical protein
MCVRINDSSFFLVFFLRYAIMFVEFESDGYFRQEVIAALVGHVGNGEADEADAAL